MTRLSQKIVKANEKSDQPTNFNRVPCSIMKGQWTTPVDNTKSQATKLKKPMKNQILVLSLFHKS